MGSTDEIPKHALCPTSEDSWCKYPIYQLNKAEHNNEEHTHLPPIIMEELQPPRTYLTLCYQASVHTEVNQV